MSKKYLTKKQKEKQDKEFLIEDLTYTLETTFLRLVKEIGFAETDKIIQRLRSEQGITNIVVTK